MDIQSTPDPLQVPPKKAEPPAPKEEPAPAPAQAGEEGEEGGQRFEARLAEALRDAQVKFLKVRGDADWLLVWQA